MVKRMVHRKRENRPCALWQLVKGQCPTVSIPMYLVPIMLQMHALLSLGATPGQMALTQTEHLYQEIGNYVA